MNRHLQIAAVVLGIWLVELVLGVASGAGGNAPSAITHVTKPADNVVQRRARRQPSVPSNYKEVPFVETAPIPRLSVEEKQRGYMLFQRPIMEPVHPNTRPLAHERLDRLTAFATPGEFEPLTFSIYPVRKLTNLRVRISSLKGPDAGIPVSEISTRLVTYWNIGYPRYTSRDTYRRLPELLERVTVHASPAGECQRWWIRVHVPEDTRPGIYRGTVTIWDDDFDQAVAIPVALRVLEFPLRRDLKKHYSVYYYARNRVQFQGKDEAFIRKAMDNEYRAMMDYGIDMVPTLNLVADAKGTQVVLQYPDALQRMLELGMTGPVAVTGGNAIERIYRATTPGGRRESHWRIDKMPGPEFYRQVTKVFRALDQRRRARGWPEFVCCPLDEVAASHQEFGSRVYQAVQDAGIRTYATKNPRAADAAPYMPYVDVWCSQPYSMPYEKIVAQSRYEYWCYPNHNAGEIKDRQVMCKGGRMTYGFGFWRSGYSTLIPWHWAWTPAPDQFDYLRGSRSGCGQRIAENGAVIPAVYWECFREGRDDERYLYTLQQAAWQREGSDNKRCQQAVAQGKQLLQQTWDSINVQQKYLASGMWPSSEFNARRWRLASAIQRLLAFPTVRSGHAPSVLVADTNPKPRAETESLVDKAARQGLMESRDLGNDFTAWHSGTKEGTIQLTKQAGRDDKVGLRWRVHVDHKVDGGEGGKYPIGWPRLSRAFGNGQLDMSAFDYLEFLVRVDSNRDEVADDSTPLRILINSHEKGRQFYNNVIDIGDRQRVWIPIRLAVKDMIRTVGLGVAPWKSISRIQLHLSEQDFRHDTQLTIDVASVRLLRFKAPVLAGIDAPEFVLLPCRVLPVRFDIVGTRSVRRESHQIRAVLIDRDGQPQARSNQDLAGTDEIVLDMSKVTPGRYTLKLDITPAHSGQATSLGTRIDCIEGPVGPLTQ